MTALKNIQNRWQSIINSSFDVPEWGDKNGPLRVFYNPLTAHNASEINRLPNGEDPKSNATIVIMRARNADGSAMFENDEGTIHILTCEAEAGVLARVAKQLMTQKTDEELEKNS